MHPRTLIRTTIQDILIAANTVAGSNVRRAPLNLISLRKADLPVISIWIPDESVTEQLPDQARERTRELAVTIEAVVPSGDDVDVAMDNLSLEIERAIDADQYLRPPTPPPGYEDGDIATDSRLTDTVMVETKTGDGMGGYVGLVWAVEYRDHAFVPEVNPDNFLIAGTIYDPNAATHPGDQPADEILVRDAP